MALKATTAEAVFLVTLVATFGVAFLARRRSVRDKNGGLAELNLNRWLVGLSAGATANSGFIATGAVGFGYSYGLKSLFLPISWLLGDLVFWYLFPARINRVGRESQATTLSEILTYKLSGWLSSALGLLCALIILVCLTGFLSAQWLTGQKFLSGAFGLPNSMALGIFALLVIAYSSIGGFRGSIYTDVLLAIIRIAGTIIALVAILWFAMDDNIAFSKHIAAAGSGFMSMHFGGIAGTASFVFGFAIAAIGFGLGQPQILTRYLAGRSPEETRSAWWIYIGFGQFTWISMIVFGVLLRGVMPGIADPETGLSVFFQNDTDAALTGIILAHVFATIAATSNGLLVTIAQTIVHDVVPRVFGDRQVRLDLSIATLLIGSVSMLISISMHGSAYSVALSSMPLMGAGLAPAVMIKVLGWRHSAASLLCAVVGGIIGAVLWQQLGLGRFLYEAGIGMACGLVINWLAVKTFTVGTKSLNPRPQ
jgi:sodium/proline symporter